MISGESGHFGVVNGEVTTVVDPVVRETPRKNSTDGVQMNNNSNSNNNNNNNNNNIYYLYCAFSMKIIKRALQTLQ